MVDPKVSPEHTSCWESFQCVLGPSAQMKGRTSIVARLLAYIPLTHSVQSSSGPLPPVQPRVAITLFITLASTGLGRRYSTFSHLIKMPGKESDVRVKYL